VALDAGLDEVDDLVAVGDVDLAVDGQQHLALSVDGGLGENGRDEFVHGHSWRSRVFDIQMIYIYSLDVKTKSRPAP